MSLLLKNEMGEGREGGGCLFKGEAFLILMPRHLFGRGCLLEHTYVDTYLRK